MIVCGQRSVEPSRPGESHPQPLSRDRNAARATTGKNALQFTFPQAPRVIQLSSSSGKIRIERCNGDKHLRASSGQITVLKSGGDIKAKTSSGRQIYEGIRGDISTVSSSGAINIRDQEGGLNLESSSAKQEGRDIRVAKDSSFRTTSGKIDFDFINNMDEFTFDLRSSSGRIEVGSTSARGRVVTGDGKILIKGKSTSGGQTYR